MWELFSKIDAKTRTPSGSQGFFLFFGLLFFFLNYVGKENVRVENILEICFFFFVFLRANGNIFLLPVAALICVSVSLLFVVGFEMCFFLGVLAHCLWYILQTFSSSLSFDFVNGGFCLATFLVLYLDFEF